MTRVMLVGYDPDTVDFSDPALPPGMNAEKIRAGIEVARQQSLNTDGRPTLSSSDLMRRPGRRWRVA